MKRRTFMNIVPFESFHKSSRSASPIGRGTIADNSGFEDLTVIEVRRIVGVERGNVINTQVESTASAPAHVGDSPTSTFTGPLP